MSDGSATPVACASYTYARRHPKVLGRIGGWAPPVQLSFVQLGTLAATLVLVAMSSNVWAPPLPPLLRFMVVTTVPAASCWAVRRTRLEGRSLVRTAIGVLTLACQPRNGFLQGRPMPSTRVIDWGSRSVWIASETSRDPG